MSKIPYKFNGLRSAVDILRYLAIIAALLLFSAAFMRVASPGINPTTYRTLPPDWTAAITFGVLAVAQLSVVSVVTGAVMVMIERERNDRITHALLMRLVRRIETEQDKAHEKEQEQE